MLSYRDICIFLITDFSYKIIKKMEIAQLSLKKLQFGGFGIFKCKTK